MLVDKGEIVPNPEGDGVRLTLTKDAGGTRISSTRYVHYGKMEFVMSECCAPFCYLQSLR